MLITRLTLTLALVLALGLLGATAPDAAAQGMSFPVHGNWCGPNHGAGPVLDLLDDACMRHDYCTIQMGRFDCSCDLALMYELRHQGWPNPWMAEKARSIYEAIAVMPCDDPNGQGQKMSLAMSDWMSDMLQGRGAPWDFLDRWGALANEGMRRAY